MRAARTAEVHLRAVAVVRLHGGLEDGERGVRRRQRVPGLARVSPGRVKARRGVVLLDLGFVQVCDLRLSMSFSL